jgi:hypothetical protein
MCVSLIAQACGRLSDNAEKFMQALVIGRSGGDQLARVFS